MFDFTAILKYFLEGLAVALAAFFIPQKTVEVKEIVIIGLTAAAVFSILDQFSPLTGSSARQGAGFGIGLNQVGFGHPAYGYYGGQDPRLSCSCEVDADYLRSQVCTESSSQESESSPGSPENIAQKVGNAASNVVSKALAESANKRGSEFPNRVTVSRGDETKNYIPGNANGSSTNGNGVNGTNGNATGANVANTNGAETNGVENGVEPFNGFAMTF